MHSRRRPRDQTRVPTRDREEDEMREAVIVEAVRTPIARGKMGKGDLSGFHAAQLLQRVQWGVLEKAGCRARSARADHRRLRDPGGRTVGQSSPATPG